MGRQLHVRGDVSWTTRTCSSEADFVTGTSKVRRTSVLFRLPTEKIFGDDGEVYQRTTHPPRPCLLHSLPERVRIRVI